MNSKLYTEALLQIDFGEYEKAAESLKQAISRRNINAMFVLGIMYLYGEGVPLDINKGKALILKAKQKKHPIATFYWDIISDTSE